jgi:hypothetical protein
MQPKLLIAAITLLSLPYSAVAAETNLEAAYKICEGMAKNPPAPEQSKSDRERYAIYGYLCLAVVSPR